MLVTMRSHLGTAQALLEDANTSLRGAGGAYAEAAALVTQALGQLARIDLTDFELWAFAEHCQYPTRSGYCDDPAAIADSTGQGWCARHAYQPCEGCDEPILRTETYCPMCQPKGAQP